MGRSKGGLTTKIDAVVDADGRPIRSISSLAPAEASMFDVRSLAANRCWPQKT